MGPLIRLQLWQMGLLLMWRGNVYYGLDELSVPTEGQRA